MELCVLRVYYEIHVDCCIQNRVEGMKINYRRKIKIRKTPVTKANKIIDPDSVYNRKREKEEFKELIRKGLYENI